jgi:hypothetical protein
VTLDKLVSCQGFGGYHDAVKITPSGGAEIIVTYSIVPRCTSSFDDLTLAASHEFMEAATDPNVGAGPLGYVMGDPLWSASYGGEVGDLCFNYSGSDTVLEGSYSVQRGWSNAAAKGSHDPCVPAPNKPYFNAAVDALATEVALAVGETASVQLLAFSDAPMADWDIAAADFIQLDTGSGGNLSFTFDKQKANNGTRIQMQVTLTGSPPNGQARYAVLSRGGGVTHMWPALVTLK